MIKILKRAFSTAVLVLLIAALLFVGGVYQVMFRATFPRTDGRAELDGLQGQVEIIRDRWGVPHIYAEFERDAYFAQGYVHAQDRLWQMEFNRRLAAGRLSEVLGESTLDTDRLVRTLGLYRAAQRDVETLPPEVLAELTAYAEGVNAFIGTHRNHLPLEFQLLGFAPEPWTVTDSLGWTKVMAMGLDGNWEDELERQRLTAKLGEQKASELFPAYPEGAPVVVPEETAGLRLADESLLTGWRQFRQLSGYPDSGSGSNNWVVDGSMTATGRPILANDPHLGIQIPSLWYEVHLVAGALDVIGASFPGCPGVVIGHNRSIAWGMTNSRVDVQDLYVEHVNDAGQYEYRGEWYDLGELTEQIWVKGRSGPVWLTVRTTRHGPLLPSDDKVQGPPLALRWTALESGSIFTSLHLLNRAENWDQFRSALRHWNSPAQNLLYADAQGNIGYQLPGVIPIRSRGQGLVPVPGWTGEYEWNGSIPFEELPSAYNPPQHYLVTANNKIVADDYPYFLSANWAEPSRAQRITQLLQGKKHLTVADMRNIQADAYSLAAARVMPYVLALGPQGWLQERAFRFFELWDCQMRPESGAAGIADVVLWRALMNTFGDELQGVQIEPGSWGRMAQVLFGSIDQADNPWFDDVTTPEVESRDQILRKSVGEAMEFWRRHYGDLVGNLDSQWAWGKVHTATFKHVLGSVPALGLLLNRGPVAAPGTWCTVNANAYYPGSFDVESLPSYRQIVDVGHWDESLYQHTTGQSGQPLSRHYDDMIGAWQAVQPQQMLYERSEVLAQAEGVLTLAPSR